MLEQLNENGKFFVWNIEKSIKLIEIELFNKNFRVVKVLYEEYAAKNVNSAAFFPLFRHLKGFSVIFEPTHSLDFSRFLR